MPNEEEEKVTALVPDEQSFDIDGIIADNADNPGKTVGFLMSGRLTGLPSVTEYNKQLDPKLHDVMDKTKRPDKMVNVDPTSDDYGVTRSIMTNQEEGIPEKCKIEPVARIALSFQKLIVNRAVGITFGNPVKYNSVQEEDIEKDLYNAVLRVLKDNKEPSLNRKIARHLYGMTEVAERWYITEGKEPHYNYSDRGTTFKFRCQVFSPKFGDTLYPYFDDARDMVAFSRLFSKKDSDGKTHSYFETYTSEYFYMWESEDNASGSLNPTGWKMMEGYPRINPYGKIPVIYGCQDQPEYEDVESLISRMEKLLSNFADTNDYHASPKIIVKGHVNSFCKKGEAGAVLELDEGADASYLAWSQAPEAIKTEYSTLKELIHTLTQTPDISWESVKGLNVSGVALKLMFMDAILKVKDKEEIWLDYLVRRINLLKVMMAVVDNAFTEASKTLFVEPEIVPYIVIDEQERANVELALAGNKQLKSRKSAMISLGVNNVDEEIEAIEDEEAEADMFEQNEPTMA